MHQILPDSRLAGMPCSITAVSCAMGGVFPKDIPELREDGYATLASANRYIRKNLDIRKRIDYRRGERPKLKDLHLNGKAIVCVLGHYLYLDGETYYSFFNNENDDVVAVWLIE